MSGGPEEPAGAPPTALAVGWLALAQVLGQEGGRGRAAQLAAITSAAGGLKVFKAALLKSRLCFAGRRSPPRCFSAPLQFPEFTWQSDRVGGAT